MNNGSDSNMPPECESTDLPDLGDPGTWYCLVRESAYTFASEHGLPARALCGRWVDLDVLTEAAAAAAGGPGVVEDCPKCRRALADLQAAGAA